MLSSGDVAQMFAAQNQMLVYGLFDPETGKIRYVGKSVSGLRRPNQHVQQSRLRDDTHKNRWVRGLLERGLKPEIQVLLKCSSTKDLSFSEVALIRQLREDGEDLTNLTDGGEGTCGYLKTERTKKKISESVRKSRQDLDVRLRISLGQSNRPFREVKSGKVFRTQMEAALELGLRRSGINNVLAGRQLSTKGYVFRYLEDTAC
jgi:hypothetical protein